MSNNFNSHVGILKFESKAETILKTMLPLEVAAYNASAQEGYKLPTYFNVVVGSQIGDNQIADGSPWINLYSGNTKFVPSSIIGCRDEITSYSLICFMGDSVRASRSSVPMVRIFARLAADLLEKYAVDAPSDTEGVCSRINWLSEVAGVTTKTGAACDLTLEMYIRSSSEYEPIKMLPYFDTASAMVPPVFMQNWINGLTATLDSEPAATVYTLQNLQFTVSSVSELELTYSGSKLDAGYIYLPSPLISQQVISAATVGTESISIDLSTWNTNVFSLLDPGEKVILRVVTWNSDTVQSCMFTIELTKEDPTP